MQQTLSSKMHRENRSVQSIKRCENVRRRPSTKNRTKKGLSNLKFEFEGKRPHGTKKDWISLRNDIFLVQKTHTSIILVIWNPGLKIFICWNHILRDLKKKELKGKDSSLSRWFDRFSLSVGSCSCSLNLTINILLNSTQSTPRKKLNWIPKVCSFRHKFATKWGSDRKVSFS